MLLVECACSHVCRTPATSHAGSANKQGLQRRVGPRHGNAGNGVYDTSAQCLHQQRGGRAGSEDSMAQGQRAPILATQPKSMSVHACCFGRRSTLPAGKQRWYVRTAADNAVPVVCFWSQDSQCAFGGGMRKLGRIAVATLRS